MPATDAFPGGGPGTGPGIEMVFRVLLSPANLIEYACAAFFIWAVLGGWKELRKTPWRAVGKLLLLYVVLMTAQFAMSALTLKFKALAGIGTWLSILIGVVFYGTVFCPYRNSPAVVTGAVAYATVMLVIELGAVLGRTLAGQFTGFNADWLGYASNILLLLMTAVILQAPIWKYYVSVHAVRLNLIAAIAATLVVVLFDYYTIHVFERGGDAKITSFVSATFFLLYWINLSIYMMTYHLTKEQTRVLELTTNAEMNKGAEALMSVTEANLEEYHKINHDLRNQYAYMQILLQKQDYAGLQSYFEELTSTFTDNLAPVVDCGNHSLNVIFNMELAKAAQAGVQLDIKAAPPHELPFRALELCKLYTNLIDNAIEACVREQAKEPEVKVLVTVKGDYLFTRISNPTKKTAVRNRSGDTEKADKRMHGKGRVIVKGIVKAYNGRLTERIEDGVYISEFMLDLNLKGGDQLVEIENRNL